MLTKDNFTLKHMMELKQNRTVDSFILERSIYAFGLLEALCRVEMPFIYKGGTSLMLLLEKPRRLSTDIFLDRPPLFYITNPRDRIDDCTLLASHRDAQYSEHEKRRITLILF